MILHALCMKMHRIFYFQTKECIILLRRHRRNNRSPLTFRLGTNNVLVPQFLGRSFKKQEISQQVVTRMQVLAFEFTNNFPGAIPPDPHSGRGRPPPAPNTQHPTQGHYAVQGHLKSPILVPIESWYTTSYLAPFSSYCQIIASEREVPHFNALAGGDRLPISP